MQCPFFPLLVCSLVKQCIDGLDHILAEGGGIADVQVAQDRKTGMPSCRS